MKQLKKAILTLLFVSSAFLSAAQQDALFSQYMFNPFVLNPAYAGCRDVFTTLLINRSQWVAIPGAPTTQSFSFNSPVKNRYGVGLQVFNDVIGPKNSIGYLGSYAYRIPLGVGKLAMGLRAGAYTYLFDWDKIEYKDPTDMYNMYGRNQKTLFNADFGLFYNTRTFYLGWSVNHIGYSKKITPVYLEGIDNYLQMNTFFTGGNTFVINERVALQPSFLLRFTEEQPMNMDINFSILMDNKASLGLSARTSSAIVLLSQFYVTDKFRFGYSYDWGLNRIGRYSKGTHEVYIGYDINVKRHKALSPRYF
jgi:type IX secretion system PorP/SprF family membrane protein